MHKQEKGNTMPSPSEPRKPASCTRQLLSFGIYSLASLGAGLVLKTVAETGMEIMAESVRRGM